MTYAYVVRQPTDEYAFSRCYGIKYIDGIHVLQKLPVKTAPRIPIDEAQPPVLRLRNLGHFVWDYCNEILTTSKFHTRYPHIRLRPGEGPILVDLDDVSTKRTSRHPED